MSIPPRYMRLKDGRAYSDEFKELVLSLVRSGKKCTEIGRTYQLSCVTVARWAKAEGIKIPYGNSNSRYTDEFKKRMIQFVESGRSALSLEKEYQVTYGTILDWCKLAGVNSAYREGGRPFTFDWSMVDWSDYDANIARKLGCSRERVRQVRNQMSQGR